MIYNFTPMNKEYANEIALKWKYKGIYSFYDMTEDKEDLEEFLDLKQWENKFAVLDADKKLVGFYSFSFENGVMWIGFGLRPELTGKGLGVSYVLSGIKFGIERYNYKENYIMLAVAKFNERAIKAYDKVGFSITEEYIQETNGGKYPFVKMRKNLDKE